MKPSCSRLVSPYLKCFALKKSFAPKAKESINSIWSSGLGMIPLTIPGLTLQSLSMGNDDDFYVVLPSNACESEHPDNIASKYTVSWENPMNFEEGDWQVAMTELTYNYTPLSVNASFGIDYFCKTRPELHLEILALKKIEQSRFEHMLKLAPQDFGTPEVFWSPVLGEQDDDFLHNFEKEFHMVPRFSFNKVDEGKYSVELYHPTREMAISFQSQEEALKFGFSELVKKSEVVNGRHFIVSSGYVDVALLEKEEIFSGGGMQIALFSTERVERHRLMINKAAYWATDYIMADSLLQEFKSIFSLLRTEKNTGILEFRLRDDVLSIHLMNGFNFVLGFDQVDFQNKYELFRGKYPVQRELGFDHMYVYASCCAPIRVGDVMVPLLKSVFIEGNPVMSSQDATRSQYRTRNFVIKNPMYVPVSGTIINSVEINIRDDSGRLVNFEPGSKTSITLHFRRRQ